MISFLAYAWGYAKAKENAEAEKVRREQVQDGSALAMMFPSGVINLGNMN